MTGRVTSCPNCGGQVEFKAGASLLAICSFCSSAVARVGDDITELEILGKVAPLANIASPLSVGLDGRYQGKSFRLLGRIQLDYGLGPWNEWYAVFDDGQWAWLAEAQGKVYLTFGKPVSDLAPLSHWRVGTRFKFGDKSLLVVERRKARFVSGEGDLPFAVAPGSEFYYCDLEGEDGLFGTLDFGTGHEAEALYLGQQLDYGSLFGKDVLDSFTATETASPAVAMNCPNCGSAVEVQAPDESMTVTCGACESVLDCSKGSELYLISSAKRKGIAPAIPLGTTGSHQGKKWTTWGHLVRSVVVDGIKYVWEEYLLRCEKDRSYAWLVVSDGHWSWIDSVSAGAVQVSGFTARFRAKKYRHFQSSSATVESLRGEFYWKVAVGDTASLDDYVSPPNVLSREKTSEEVSWSLGTYLTVPELEQIFKGAKKLKLRKPTGVAPNQPNPNAAARMGAVRLGAVFTALMILLGFAIMARSSGQTIFSDTIRLPAVATPALSREQQEQTVVLTEPFDLVGSSNLEVSVRADVDNSWAFVSGALINEDSGEVRSFGVEVSYYHGYTGGESWSEGGRSKTVYLGRVAPGRYVLRLQPEWERNAAKPPYPGRNPSSCTVTVKSDVFLLSHWFLFAVLLWLPPVMALFRYLNFEKRRWMESDHAP